MAQIQLGQTQRGSKARPRIHLQSLLVTCLAVLVLAWLWYYPRLLMIQTFPNADFMNDISPASLSGQQYVRYNKRGKEVMHRIDRVRIEDLRDLTDDFLLELQRNQSSSALDNMQEASYGKEILLNELYRSGIKDMDIATVQLLPSWEEVSHLYYRDAPTCQPIIYGLDQCRAFQRRHTSSSQSFLATAGLYNTGTNALTYYLRANLQIRDNPLFHGVLVQVPWHKHWFVDQRATHRIPYLANISLDDVLPIVTIRDPLSWAQSMCTQPYDVEWTETYDKSTRTITKTPPPSCPSPHDETASIRIPKQTGDKTFSSLFALWNEWYSAYLDAAAAGLNFVMIRHEDLIFCPRQVLAAIQECSGASWISKDEFIYVVDQAKWEHARLSGKAQSNRISAMIKHGHARGRRIRNLHHRHHHHPTTKTDALLSLSLNQTLLELFGYQIHDVS